MERGLSWGDGKGTLNEYIIRRASEHLADSKKYLWPSEIFYEFSIEWSNFFLDELMLY